jgi:uncharacterized membrane protein
MSFLICSFQPFFSKNMTNKNKKTSFFQNFKRNLGKQYAEGKKHFIKTTGQGFGWALPVWGVVGILFFAYGKIELVVGKMFGVFGVNPSHYEDLWTFLGIVILVLFHFFLAIFLKTGSGFVFNKIAQKVLNKLPFYSTSKSVTSSLNSDESKKKKVLITMVPGIIADSYMETIMTSVKESAIKDRYTVTATMTPLPTGGFFGNIHKSKILVIEEASFEDYGKYLMSMGTKSFAEVLGIEPKEIEEFLTLEQYLDRQKEKQKLLEVEKGKKKANVKVKTPAKKTKKAESKTDTKK